MRFAPCTIEGLARLQKMQRESAEAIARERERAEAIARERERVALVAYAAHIARDANTDRLAREADVEQAKEIQSNHSPLIRR